jgi:hypothetical protein
MHPENNLLLITLKHPPILSPCKVNDSLIALDAEVRLISYNAYDFSNTTWFGVSRGNESCVVYTLQLGFPHTCWDRVSWKIWFHNAPRQKRGTASLSTPQQNSTKQFHPSTKLHNKHEYTPAHTHTIYSNNFHVVCVVTTWNIFSSNNMSLIQIPRKFDIKFSHFPLVDKTTTRHTVTSTTKCSSIHKSTKKITNRTTPIKQPRESPLVSQVKLNYINFIPVYSVIVSRRRRVNIYKSHHIH